MANISIVFGFVKRKEFVDLKYSGFLVCALATFAAVQECHLIRTGVYKS